MNRSLRIAILFASALATAACDPQEPASTQLEAPQASETTDESFSAGSVRASLNGGAATTMQASECSIVNQGENGVVRTPDGAFELSWANGSYRATWSSAEGLFNGSVTGSVDGATVSFEGNSGGATIAGSASCA
ncbi:MAG: hypothetical protein AB7T59_00310 [Hyphomonadaceae bacterium]